MARVNFILLLFLVVLSSLTIAIPIDNDNDAHYYENVSTVTNTPNSMSSDVKNILSWVSYGKRTYYNYEPEVKVIRCIMSKLWHITDNYLRNKYNDEDILRLPYVTSITPSSLSSTIENSSRNESIKIFNSTTADADGMDIEMKADSREGRGGLERGRLASLLGVTGERFVKDYNSTVVAGRKVDESNEKSTEGDVERAVLQVILQSEPVGTLIVKMINVIVYVIQGVTYWIKKSVIMSCVVDYVYEKISDWIYYDI